MRSTPPGFKVVEKGQGRKPASVTVEPKSRDEAISRLKQHEADLKRLGVEHLYLFGATTRGEAKEESGVDLFFDYGKGKPVSTLLCRSTNHQITRSAPPRIPSNFLIQ
jgi:hypothetical protein